MTHHSHKKVSFKKLGFKLKLSYITGKTKNILFFLIIAKKETQKIELTLFMYLSRNSSI